MEKTVPRTEVQVKGERTRQSSTKKTEKPPPTPPLPPPQPQGASYEGWALTSHQDGDCPTRRQRDLVVHTHGEVAEPRETIRRSHKAGKKGGGKTGRDTGKKTQDNKGPCPPPPIPAAVSHLAVDEAHWAARTSVPGREAPAQENPTTTAPPGLTDLRPGPEGAPDPDPQQWSRPAETPPAWGTSHHRCRRPLSEYRVYTQDCTLPRAREVERPRGSAQGGGRRPDTSPRGALPRSATNGDLSDFNRSTSFGRFEGVRQQPSPLLKDENATVVAEQSSCESSDQTRPGGLGKKMKAISLTMRRRMGRKHVQSFSEEKGETDRHTDPEGEAESGPPLENGSKGKTSNSLESLYSGQSSSSGVTSVSDGSSPRDSRLQEAGSDQGQFCGRARVHTHFVPSPYDTDSLKLKVGDIISVISKPPMGIWTGMLNNQVGNFKFIYVDVLVEKENEEEAPKVRPQKLSKRPRPKTLLELLENIHMEEYASALLLNGYQTVEDLMHLQEKHLIELNILDSEHRQRLLAAAACRYAESEEVREGEEAQSSSPHLLEEEERSDCPRDSGCFIPSEVPEHSKDKEDQPDAHTADT